MNDNRYEFDQHKISFAHSKGLIDNCPESFAPGTSIYSSERRNFLYRNS